MQLTLQEGGTRKNGKDMEGPVSQGSREGEDDRETILKTSSKSRQRLEQECKRGAKNVVFERTFFLVYGILGNIGKEFDLSNISRDENEIKVSQGRAICRKSKTVNRPHKK